MASKDMFSPVTIKGIEAKNRFIRSATNDHLGNTDGTVSDAEIDMYDSLASKDVGTIITGHLSVSPHLDYRADEAQLCIGDDGYIDGLSRIPAKIHEYGSVAIAQLSHAGPKGLHPIDFNMLTTADMETIRDWFVNAAVRAEKAGFDGVQIHIAHWYLLQAVVNTDFNHRTDRYGGSTENMIRLPQEIVEGIRAACRPGFIIMVKLNAHNTAAGIDDYGILAQYVMNLRQAGVDLFEISGTDFARQNRKAELYYIEAARYLRKQIPDIMLSLVGGIYSSDTVRKALEITDMVSLSRALLTQPDFVVRLKAGEDVKSRCLHCNKCFEIFQTKYERCVYGPVIPKLQATFAHEQTPH